MDINQLTELLDKEWDSDGFLGQIRIGQFSKNEGAKFLELLGSTVLNDDACIPKRFLALIWYMPSFLSWQRDRVAEMGGDVGAYEKFVTDVQNTLEQVLGVP